jgi:hypothetical protein
MNPCPLPVHRFEAVGLPARQEARCRACNSVLSADAARWYLRGAADMARGMVREAEINDRALDFARSGVIGRALARGYDIQR